MNTINEFFGSIYRWMAIGVLFTAIISYFTITSGTLAYLSVNPVIFYILIGVHLVLYLGIQFMQNKLSVPAAFALFFLYAGLTGVILSSILAFFFATNPTILYGVFGVTILLFAGLSILGRTMKKDITGWGVFLGASTFGIVLLSILNVAFFKAPLFALFIAFAVLIVFAALTVYDGQYYTRLYPTLETEEQKRKASIIAALHMYVQFIAMFQSLLRIVGFFNNN